LTDLACRRPPLRRDAAGRPLRSTTPSSSDPRLAAGLPPHRASVGLQHHRVGPSRASVGNAQAKRGSCPFAALPRPNRSRERVFRPLPRQSYFGNPSAQFRPKQLPKLLTCSFQRDLQLCSSIDKLSRSQFAVFRSE
jgi:hypothetical protein